MGRAIFVGINSFSSVLLLDKIDYFLFFKFIKMIHERCPIVRYSKQIKEIVMAQCKNPGEEISIKDKNTYRICGNIAVVKALIKCPSDLFADLQIKNEAYFLIDADDIDLLNAYKYSITIRKKYLHISVSYSTDYYHLFMGLLNKKYPRTDPRKKGYEHINNNPLDFRKENLRESYSGRKRHRENISGVEGVHKRKFKKGLSYWIATYKRANILKEKYFRIEKFGDDIALENAIQFRRSWEQRYSR